MGKKGKNSAGKHHLRGSPAWVLHVLGMRARMTETAHVHCVHFPSARGRGASPARAHVGQSVRASHRMWIGLGVVHCARAVCTIGLHA